MRKFTLARIAPIALAVMLSPPAQAADLLSFDFQNAPTGDILNPSVLTTSSSNRFKLTPVDTTANAWSGSLPTVNTGSIAALAGLSSEVSSGFISIARSSSPDSRGLVSIDTPQGSNNGEIRDYLGGGYGNNFAEFVFRPNFDEMSSARAFFASTIFTNAGFRFGLLYNGSGGILLRLGSGDLTLSGIDLDTSKFYYLGASWNVDGTAIDGLSLYLRELSFGATTAIYNSSTPIAATAEAPPRVLALGVRSNNNSSDQIIDETASLGGENANSDISYINFAQNLTGNTVLTQANFDSRYNTLIPEPQTYALWAGVIVGMIACIVRRQRRR